MRRLLLFIFIRSVFAAPPLRDSNKSCRKRRDGGLKVKNEAAGVGGGAQKAAL